MIAKLLLQNSFFIVVFATLLFGAAGTLHWPGAWVFLLVSATLGPACGLWLARTDPALLAERLRLTFQAEQPAADKKFMLAFAVASLLTFLALVTLGVKKVIEWRDATTVAGRSPAERRQPVSSPARKEAAS